MFFDDVRNHCIQKAGVTEGFPFDKSTLVFKVYGKMFALADVDVFESINLKYPALSILVHSMQPVEVYGKIANKYNIHSYLHKGASESEIFYQLELFVKNQPLNIKKKLDDSVNPFSTLAVRELEILHYLLNGHRTKEIATSLGLKMNTVSTIKSNIFEKVKAESFTHLLQLAHVHQISY